MKLTSTEFLLLHLTDNMKYQAIVDKFKIERTTLTKWWNENLEVRSIIKKSNQLYNSKKGLPGFNSNKFPDKRIFYNWYSSQLNIQNNACYYCETKQEHLKVLFNSETLSTKRNRGASLEVERLDSKTNEYSPENCVLACYFCNNHKSDIISSKDHIKYFAPSIGKYLKAKYKLIGKK